MDPPINLFGQPRSRADRLSSPEARAAFQVHSAHELIRQFGQGSYGEVWLGRSVTGAFRAIKIVHREDFRSDQPYDREFNGIKKFEPISRSHEGFIDVLHVARIDAAGYFYYVMELGDDAERGQLIDPDTYTPRTISSALVRQGRFSLAQCLQIGISLSDALGHFHRQGLVHRDIKPANIIFVNGVPKLADIGLVTDAGAECSFVGTEGYIPQEGPGLPTADIFSLGKVLYEISTGNDRMRFPDLPEALLQESDDLPRVQEFNEIVLKACDQDVTLRYQTAEELHAHLALLQAGKSVRRLLRAERWLRAVRRYGVVAVVVVALASVAWFHFARERSLAREEARRLAENRRRQAELYISYGTVAMEAGDYLEAAPWFAAAFRQEPERRSLHGLRLASVLRQSPTTIRRWSPPHAMGHGEFGTNDDEVLISCPDGRSALWRVSTGEQITPAVGSTRYSQQAFFSRDRSQFATVYGDGKASIWSTKDQASLAQFSQPGWIFAAAFSPDGRRLATCGNDGQSRIWDLSTKQQLFGATNTNYMVFITFSHDGKRYATASRDNTATIWSAETGKVISVFAHHDSWVNYVQFSPDDRLLATCSADRTARLWEISTGREVIAPLKHDDIVSSVEFSPDGKYFVTACWDGTARVWSTANGERASAPLRHDNRVRHAIFSPTGRRILTVCNESEIRVWELPELTLPTVARRRFNARGTRCLTLEESRIDVSDALKSNRICRVTAPSSPVTAAQLNDAGDLLAATGLARPLAGESNHRWIRAWKMPGGDPIGKEISTSPALGNLALSGDGRWAAAYSEHEIQIFELLTGARVFAQTLKKGDLRAVAFNGKRDQVALMRKRALAVWSLQSGGSAAQPVFEIVPLALGRADDALSEFQSTIFSPDGTRLLTMELDGTLARRPARLWDTGTGRPVGAPMMHRDGIKFGLFSPDGRRVLTCGEDFSAMFWDVETALALPLPRLTHRDQVNHAAFSDDGAWVATGGKDGVARLWDAATGRPLTPPFRHPGSVEYVQIVAGGRCLFTEYLEDDQLKDALWPLPTGEGAADALALEVEKTLSGTAPFRSTLPTPTSGDLSRQNPAGEE